MMDPREGAEFFPGIYIKENLSLAYVAQPQTRIYL